MNTNAQHAHKLGTGKQRADDKHRTKRQRISERHRKFSEQQPFAHIEMHAPPAPVIRDTKCDTKCDTNCDTKCDTNCDSGSTYQAWEEHLRLLETSRHTHTQNCQ
jgi:hypothetical protein